MAKGKPTLKAKPKKLNKFIVKGADAEIHSDFDCNGKLELSVAERKARYKRPGAVILPNLNLSKLKPKDSPGVDPYKNRDADDMNIQGIADLPDLTEFTVKSPKTPLLADEVLLHARTEDIDRFRLFLKNAGTPDTWSLIFGKGKGNDQPVSFPAKASWQQEYVMEALTLAGNPKAKGPAGATPNPPLPPPKSFNKAGKGSTPKGSGKPIYPKTGPGEIWVELLHKKGGKKLNYNYDVALFLIAPFLLQSNLEPCERVYVCNLPENHDFVYDLMEACWKAFGGAGSFDRDTSLLFVSSTPADLTKAHDTTPGKFILSPGRLYLIDGAKYPDDWVQDQFEMGYCSAPDNRAFNIVFHCKRDRALAEFVKQELAHKDIAIFNEIEGIEQDSTDYGGNIEVSPPVATGTKEEKKGNAGPKIQAHPPAPFGKIILGDYKNTARSGEGLVHDETRDVLKSQIVQPIIPINTSWLGVGHVDEIMSFLPANTSRGSALLIASVNMMDKLLEEVKNVNVKDGRTNFHRGKFEEYRLMVLLGVGGATITDPVVWRGTPYPTWSSYSEISVEDLYGGSVGDYSRKIRIKFMKSIEQRLMRCTNHGKNDVIKVPIYFKPGRDPSKPYGNDLNITVAETVGMVNMQVVNKNVVNKNLMVPQPFGPRMPKAKAKSIVEKVLKGMKAKDMPDTGFTFWAWPGLSLARVAQFFAHPDTAARRKEIIEKIKNPAHVLGAALDKLIDDKKTEIKKKNPGLPLNVAEVFTAWKRLFIPEKTVDIIEMYMLTVLSKIGCEVHFVDDWYYHVGWGEAHCGTNAKRTPPKEATLAKKWWEIYDPAVDTSYDPKA